MIKTLRITSIVAIALSLVFFTFSVVFGLRGDENIEKLLKSPSAIEEFQKQGKKASKAKSQTSPLTAQAKAFTLYLNPPRPIAPALRPLLTKSTTPAAIAAAIRPTGKFKLLGTCVNKSNPALSTALIELPNKKTKWVKQSSKVEHAIIEEIKDGVIMVRSGEKLSEYVSPERPDRLTYLKKTGEKKVDLTEDKEIDLQEVIKLLGVDLPAKPPARVAPAPPKSPTAGKQTTRRVRGAGAWPRKKEPLSEENQAKQKEKHIRFIEGLMGDPNSMGIGAEEANNLAGLEDMLKSLQEEE